MKHEKRQNTPREQTKFDKTAPNTKSSKNDTLETNHADKELEMPAQHTPIAVVKQRRCNFVEIIQKCRS